ncbi:hypothetical protein L5515_013688 [Caenorhabditis briggsae]|uniref:RING-type domain-containing protein n=1 Tax=Caenorhabditis briggsae TaxID=6238 RepID=A0AAE9E9E9_CAEBR|nr:hypothetical protein L5515_013688 [Caenorhabditis briggsae]
MNLNSPEAVLSPECVLLTTLNYVLDDITAKMTPDLSKFNAPTSYVKDKGEELVVRLFENSNLSLRMYGSSEELAGNVKIYRNSPGSGLYADANGYLLYPYYTTPVIYRSLKDEQYLCKSDAYVVLQNLTLEVYPFEKPQVLRVLLAIFLRSQELKNLKRKQFGDQIKDIEFIRLPILRAKDKAVPLQELVICLILLSSASWCVFLRNAQSSKSLYTIKKDVQELEEFEDQKQKIQEKEKEIQEKSEEIEQLKRKVEENLKIDEEKEQLISEVTKLTNSIVELNEEHSKQKQKLLESQNQQFDQISHLEYELDMARQTTKILNQKILELENQKAENENWQAEKQNLHLEIQEKRGKIKEFYVENIRMRTENEVNQRMIQQLLEKLASVTSAGNSYSNPPAALSVRDYSNPGQGPYDDPPYMSNDRRPESSSTYSTSLDDAPNASSYSNHHETPPASNYNNPGTSNCKLCRHELKSDDQIYKCYQCRCPSHTNCASNWLKTRQECPSCNEKMYNFLKIPDKAHTPGCLFQQFIRYSFYKINFSPEGYVRSNGWSQEEKKIAFLQNLMEEMGQKSGMFGSAEELLENLKIYADFPGNDDFFDTKFEHYQKPPTVYFSLKNNEKYIAKPDLFGILQNIMFSIADAPL